MMLNSATPPSPPPTPRMGCASPGARNAGPEEAPKSFGAPQPDRGEPERAGPRGRPAKSRLAGLLNAVLLIVLLSLAAAPVRAAEIVWSDQLFTRNSFDEDVKTLLGQVLEFNGLAAFFRPGVDGGVTFNFQNMPLQAAFNKLIEEHGLAYSFDEVNRTVTIFPASSTISSEHIYTPTYASLDEIMGALRRFRLLNGEVDIQPDRSTASLFLQGAQDRVAALVNLMNQVDGAFATRQQRLIAEGRQTLEQRRQDLEADQIGMAMAQTQPVVRVFTLRYANVGPTTTTFQGQSITAPGIIDSLRAFLGADAIATTGTDGAAATPAAPSQAAAPVITIDTRTNSLIVQGTQAQIDRIATVLDDLDQPVPLVEIEVIIVNGEDSLSRNLGIQLGATQVLDRPGLEPGVTSILTNPTNITLANSGAIATQSGLAQLTAAGITAAGAPTGLAGGFLYHGGRNMLQATLNYLHNTSRTQTVAAPRIVTLNNQSAQVTNTTHINFFTTAANGDSTTSDMQTVSGGISLQITPAVIAPEENSDSPMVRMEITAQNSTPGTPTGGVVNVADQEIQTSVIIPEESTFVMGGFFSTERTETKNGVPFLMDIPVLGALFRNTGSADNRTETVFLITPKVYAITDINPNQGRPTREYVEHQRYLMQRSQAQLRRNSQNISLNLQVDEDE